MGEMMQHIQLFPLTLTLSLMERGLKTLLAASQNESGERMSI
jgi:hypothetical protein